MVEPAATRLYAFSPDDDRVDDDGRRDAYGYDDADERERRRREKTRAAERRGGFKILERAPSRAEATRDGRGSENEEYGRRFEDDCGRGRLDGYERRGGGRVRGLFGRGGRGGRGGRDWRDAARGG